jgi:hypothetical protein
MASDPLQGTTFVPMRYYGIRCRLDGIDWHFVWYTNDADGVLVDGDGSILAFRNQSDLEIYAARLGFEFEAEEPILYDLDAIDRWLEDPRGSAIDCKLFLDAWNLFDDVASSIQSRLFEWTSREADGPYDKLYWGNNLPAVTPPGKRYEPIWSDDEVETLQKILGEGISLVRFALREEA